MKTLKQSLKESVINESSSKRVWYTAGGALYVEIMKCDSIYAVEDSLEFLIPEGGTENYACKNHLGLDEGHVYQMFCYEYDDDNATEVEEMIGCTQFLFYINGVTNTVVFIGADGSKIFSGLKA